MIQPWPLLQSRQIGDFRIFQLRQDDKVSPRTGETHGFYVLDSSDWVNVIALTPRRELIMVEQFRHGTNSVELEIPGGIVDDDDASPVATAVRELREETGYEGSGARVLADFSPNPAILSNTCHLICVEQCEKRHELKLDSGEDMITHLVPVGEVPSLVAAGRIRHAVVLAGLHFLDLWVRGITS